MQIAYSATINNVLLSYAGWEKWKLLLTMDKHSIIILWCLWKQLSPWLNIQLVVSISRSRSPSRGHWWLARRSIRTSVCVLCWNTPYMISTKQANEKKTLHGHGCWYMDIIRIAKARVYNSLFVRGWSNFHVLAAKRHGSAMVVCLGADTMDCIREAIETKWVHFT